MFSDEIVGEVVFKSSWKKERDCSSSSTQTRPLQTVEVSTQARKKREAGVQTDADSKDYQLVDESDSQVLLEFLKRVEPTFSKALLRNIQSSAFDGYTSMNELDEGKCNVLHTLTNEEHGGHLAITSLSWNSTGSVIAASYGRYDHEDWCVHKSSLCTWNVNKSAVQGNKADTVIDVSSCLMSVHFHPVEPGLIAGGTFNGEVMVWDYSREGDLLLATSVKGEQSHNEPISKVLWQKTPGKRRQYRILSVGMDGKILVWKLDKDKGRLTYSKGFLMLARHMPKSVKIKSSKKNQEMGITSLSFSHIDDQTFYMGVESGAMFKCTTSASSEIDDGSHANPLIDPVSFTFTPHKGPVYSMMSSPYHRNLVVTCSSDTTIRLHSSLQAQPLLVIEPSSGYLYTVRWSPTRPLVLAVTTQDGQLLIYDLKKNQTTPVEALQASSSKQPAFAMEFNSKQTHLIAAGDAAGVVTVWKLPQELSTESTPEVDLLNDIADTSANE